MIHREASFSNDWGTRFAQRFDFLVTLCGVVVTLHVFESKPSVLDQTLFQHRNRFSDTKTKSCVLCPYNWFGAF